MTSFVLGGGCFWCLDSSYMQFKGVSDVVVGYMGGKNDNPTYEQVCNGNTGHAEVAEVIFDESVISPEVILDIFFTIHDPRQLNRQGNDIGTQYRSVMYYKDDAQKALFEAAIERAKEHWDGEIVTELSPAETFWVGEEYHQDFFAKNPNQGYCVAVVSPKMAKARASYSHLLL
ncbi:MAG: peptide-methionine (S)-S-oxide reductase MsrA [Rhodoluna sp.]|nr:peptide-methionine (S)-S-oxide reductase MsrA [Rhodoluna sp.]